MDDTCISFIETFQHVETSSADAMPEAKYSKQSKGLSCCTKYQRLRNKSLLDNNGKFYPLLYP